TRFSAKTSVVTRCRTGPAIRRNGWRRIRRRWRRWRAAPRWPPRESAASRPKNNSSATLKAARSRANRRHHYRTNLIPRRNATSPIRTAAELTQCGSDQGQLVPLVEAHREQSRPQARAGLSGLWLLQRTQSQSARSPWYRHEVEGRLRPSL